MQVKTHSLSNNNILNLLTQLKYFLKFYRSATTLYNVHSKWVYGLVDFIFNNKIPTEQALEYDSIRKKLLSDHREIDNHDLGAGSLKNKAKDEIEISRIASISMSGNRKMKWLYNMAEYFKPDITVELGTSLGLSAAHLAAHSRKVLTIEGNPAIASVARETFKELDCNNTDCLIGSFDDLLPGLLANEKPDLIYLDGNHTYQATMQYFYLILEKTPDHRPVLIFDDIYWSEGMVKAWEKIKANPEVRLTIDLYHFGLVVFNEDIIAPRHYTLVPYIWKPWHIGFRPVR